MVCGDTDWKNIQLVGRRWYSRLWSSNMAVLRNFLSLMVW